MQAEVCVEHTNERDIGEVQAFGDHLGADDDVDFALAKFLQGFTQGVFTAHGVGVDACDSCLWEYFFDDALYLLGAVALAADGGVTTLGTFLGGQCLVATHVADEAVISAVIGERDSTVAALANMTTAGTLHGAGESTAIEKQDDLLSLGKLNLHTATQGIGEDGGPTFVFFAFDAHVNDADDGQGLSIGTFGKGQQVVFVGFGIMK